MREAIKRLGIHRTELVQRHLKSDYTSPKRLLMYIYSSKHLDFALVGLRMAHRLIVIPLESSTGVMFGEMNRPILGGGGGDISTGCNPTSGLIYI